MVEVTGLEPTTFWSLTRRATKLRYTSIYELEPTAFDLTETRYKVRYISANLNNNNIILKIIKNASSFYIF